MADGARAEGTRHRPSGRTRSQDGEPSCRTSIVPAALAVVAAQRAVRVASMFHQNLEEKRSAREAVDAKTRKMLAAQPDARTDFMITHIAEVARALAPSFCSQLSEAVILDLARCFQFKDYAPNTHVCDMGEECEFLFIVVGGDVEVKELKVSHSESREKTDAEDEGTWHSDYRIYTAKQGHAFGHFPLIQQSMLYGYSAKTLSSGAAFLLVHRSDYVQKLRREVEKHMLDSVSMLKSLSFFSDWTHAAVSRFYFWFERRRVQVGEDVVTQGDNADFCFIIRSGACDVLVRQMQESVPPSPAKDAPAPAAAAPLSPAAGASPISESGKKGRRFVEIKEDPVMQKKAALFLERHIVTLRPGAMVGEIALLFGGVRTATVRAAIPSEVLVLDQKALFDLDRSTIQTMKEIAMYNKACTKDPASRTEEDIEILAKRSGYLLEKMSISPELLRKLLHVMKYRSIDKGKPIVTKGAPAQCLVLLTGSASTVVSTGTSSVDQSKRASVRRQAKAPAKAAATPSAAGGAQGSVSSAGTSLQAVAPISRFNNGDSSKQSKTTKAELFRPGDLIGEAELLEGLEVYENTIVSNESCAIMEISLADFDRLLRDLRYQEQMRLIDFLQQVTALKDLSKEEMTSLVKSVLKKSFVRGQLCYAHPPSAELHGASHSYDYVSIIIEGEVRLLAGVSEVEKDGSRPPTADMEYLNLLTSAAEVQTLIPGPASDAAMPSNRQVEAHLNASLTQIASLGPTECIFGNMLAPNPDARWCLEALTPIKVLVIPISEWRDHVPPEALHQMEQIALKRSTFFRSRIRDHHKDEQGGFSPRGLGRLKALKALALLGVKRPPSKEFDEPHHSHHAHTHKLKKKHSAQHPDVELPPMSREPSNKVALLEAFSAEHPLAKARAADASNHVDMPFILRSSSSRSGDLRVIPSREPSCSRMPTDPAGSNGIPGFYPLDIARLRSRATPHLSSSEMLEEVSECSSPATPRPMQSSAPQHDVSLPPISLSTRMVNSLAPEGGYFSSVNGRLGSPRGSQETTPRGRVLPDGFKRRQMEHVLRSRWVPEALHVETRPGTGAASRSPKPIRLRPHAPTSTVAATTPETGVRPIRRDIPYRRLRKYTLPLEPAAPSGARPWERTEGDDPGGPGSLAHAIRIRRHRAGILKVPVQTTTL
mmetsp:Transcript_28197/g.68475  ORF Transcript_28197/g.68475 Transcript_28197/m.68475 type:complete len:1165 (-) Transcript_28197:240-3734(-)